MKRSGRQGFTLLELVVVLVLIGFSIAVAYPALSRGMATLHLRSAGRDVINCLRYAREKAVTEQAGVLVSVDREEQKLVLTDDFGEGARAFVLPQDIKIERLALAGQEVLEGPLVVRFLPNGSSTEAEIVLQSATGGVLRIVTDPITGGARMRRGHQGGDG